MVQRRGKVVHFQTYGRRDLEAGTPGEPLLVVEDRSDASSRYTRPRTYLSGAGGMASTASDYMRFCKMLATGGELDGRRVIGPRTLAYMACNHLPGAATWRR
jgi:CubicO group peptidase (beta-lactamase class C family)